MRKKYEGLLCEKKYKDIKYKKFINIPLEFILKIIQLTSAPDLDIFENTLVNLNAILPLLRINIYPIAS